MEVGGKGGCSGSQRALGHPQPSPPKLRELGSDLIPTGEFNGVWLLGERGSDHLGVLEGRGSYLEGNPAQTCEKGCSEVRAEREAGAQR